jgi:hypothetical protein
VNWPWVRWARVVRGARLGTPAEPLRRVAVDLLWRMLAPSPLRKPALVGEAPSQSPVDALWTAGIFDGPESSLTVVLALGYTHVLLVAAHGLSRWLSALTLDPDGE